MMRRMKTIFEIAICLISASLSLIDLLVRISNLMLPFNLGYIFSISLTASTAVFAWLSPRRRLIFKGSALAVVVKTAKIKLQKPI